MAIEAGSGLVLEGLLSAVMRVCLMSEKQRREHVVKIRAFLADVVPDRTQLPECLPHALHYDVALVVSDGLAGLS